MTMTGYFTHPDCRKHEMGPGHPECPERLDAIEDRLLITGLGLALDRREAPVAALADIELAHSRLHVAALRAIERFLKPRAPINVNGRIVFTASFRGATGPSN